MLNSLKPPTDNLYKFVAISGLTCFVVGMVLSVQQTGKTLDSAYAAEDALQEAWLALAEGFQDGDDETELEMLNRAWQRAAKGGEAFGLTQELRKLGTLTEAELAAVRQFEIAANSLSNQWRIHEITRTWLSWMVVVSLGIMLLGFGLWYSRTQRHQDKLLRMQTQEQTPVEEQDGPAKAYQRWTEDEEKKLREGFKNGRTFKQLAKEHGRTRGAIRSRLVKLGLIDDPQSAS